MNTEDYAIVVGIERYPELGEGGTPLDLKGPTSDVDAVVAWLTDPAGGNLPPGSPNIQVIRSSEFTVPTSANDALPTIVELEKALERLDKIAHDNRDARKGLRVGRRLYIYMSGHGFSPARERGCLYAANARERAGHNVHVSGWLAWLQDAGYFREFVLWMDCCMNRMSFLPPRDPPLPPVNVLTPPGPTFIAFAAQRPLKAVEAAIPEDGGRHHGLFTWTLLEGLRGAAANANGRVTGRSLADWIRNAQSARMNPRDREDPEVTKEPEIVREDAGLIFARGVQTRSYPVRLSFAAGTPAGAQVRLWTGAPPRVAQQFQVGSEPHDLALQPGLYLIDSPDKGLRQGFEVVGPTSLEIAEQGLPVVPAAEGAGMFDLEVIPTDQATEIFIVDHRFSLVEGSPGQLRSPLPFGLFKVKTRLGRGLRERVILLDRDRPQLDPQAIVQPLAAAAPVAGTAATHEYQVAARVQAAEEARVLGLSGHSAALTVMARVWSETGQAPPDAKPWEGITVLDEKGKRVLDLDREGERETSRDPFAVRTLSVPPGTYFLRQFLSAAATGTKPLVLEQSLVVPRHWGIEAHILRRATPEGDRISPRPRLSLLMHDLRNPQAKDSTKDRLIEAARIALADERRILNAELEELLMRKFEDPMAGILGAHLLLVEAERDPLRPLEMLNEVVTNLRRLVGPDHPDVEALSLRCPDPELRRRRAVVAPPMLQRSWRLLVEASFAQPMLIPSGLWERVHAQGSLPPFFVWVADEEIRSAFRRELARQALRPATREEMVAVGATAPPADPVGTPTASGLEAFAAAPAGDLTPGQAMPSFAMRLPAPSLRHAPDRKVVKERARRLQIPASVLKLLAKEYQENPAE